MMENRTFDFHDLKAGDFSIFTKTCTETEAMLYAGLSGDMNPYHLNEEYAKPAFGHLIINAAHLQALAQGAVYRLLPAGSVRLCGEYRLIKAAPCGETIIARAEILKLDQEKGTVEVAWECYSNDKELLLEGKSVEQFWDREKEKKDADQ